MASALILLPVYAHYLSAPVYALMILYTGFSALIQIVVTYSFDVSLYNYFHEYKSDPPKLAAYVSSAFAFILLLSLATGIVLAFVGDFVFAKVYDNSISFYPYGLLSVVTGVFQSVFKVNNSLLQTQEKAVAFLRMNVLSLSLIAAGTFIGLYLFPDSLIGPIGGRLVAVTLTGLWVLWRVYRQFGWHVDFSFLNPTLSFNHPQFIYQVILWFNNVYDRVVLSRFLPLTQVAIYDLAAKCLMAVEFVLTGFYNSFFPKVLGITALQVHKKTTPEINRYYHGLTAVTILLVAGSVLVLPPVFQWFVQKPAFLAAIRWFPFVAVTYLLRSLRFFVAMPYAAIKYSKPLPIFYGVIVATKVGGMFLLIPSYGIMGLLVATWIGYIVEIAVLYFGVRSKFEMTFNVFKLIVAPLTLAVVIVIFEPLFGTAFPFLTHLAYVLVAGLLLLWAYRNEIRVFKLSNLIK